MHYVGCAPRLYPINFHSIIARRLRRSVLVMIIPLHIFRATYFLSDDTRSLAGRGGYDG